MLRYLTRMTDKVDAKRPGRVGPNFKCRAFLEFYSVDSHNNRSQLSNRRSVAGAGPERTDDLILSPCYETMSLQIGLVGRDGVLVPFKANARHIRNVKQSVTDFIR